MSLNPDSGAFYCLCEGFSGCPTGNEYKEPYDSVELNLSVEFCHLGWFLNFGNSEWDRT